MERALDFRKSQVHEKLRWLGAAAVAGIVVMGGWLTIETVINGPGVWEQLDQKDSAERHKEDLSFCGKFGMAPGTEAFAVCARELVHVRRTEAARTHRRLNFF